MTDLERALDDDFSTVTPEEMEAVVDFYDNAVATHFAAVKEEVKLQLEKTSELTDLHYYIGDETPEYGGAWFNLENWEDGLITGLELIDLSNFTVNGEVEIREFNLVVERDLEEIRELFRFTNLGKFGTRNLTFKRVMFADMVLNHYGPDEVTDSTVFQLDDNETTSTGIHKTYLEFLAYVKSLVWDWR